MKKMITCFLIVLTILAMSIVSFASPICDKCHEGKILNYSMTKSYIFDLPHTYYLIFSGECDTCGEDYNYISGPYKD